MLNPLMTIALPTAILAHPGVVPHPHGAAHTVGLVAAAAVLVALVRAAVLMLRKEHTMQHEVG